MKKFLFFCCASILIFIQSNIVLSKNNINVWAELMEKC